MRSQRGLNALALLADRLRLAGQQPQGRQFSGQLFRVQIEAQRGLQRREGHFIRPQGALERMALQTRDQRFFTDDNSRHRLFRQAVLA